MTSNTYTPERDITPQFLATISDWIDSSREVFVVLRYLRAGGAKDYAFIRNRSEFDRLIESVAVGTDIIVFKEPQLLIRGKVSAEFIEEAKRHIDDGEEYLFVRLTPEKSGDLKLFGEMGDSYLELEEELREEQGESVALGLCPPFTDGDNKLMISASKGGIDGAR